MSATFVSYDDGLRLWEAVARLSRDPAVGLHAGARTTLDQFSVLGSMFVHARDLRDALERVVRFLPLVIRPARIELREDERGEVFCYESPSTARHGVDAMLAAVVKLARECTEREIIPLAVSFQSDLPVDVIPYESYFGVRPTWSQPTSGLLIGRDDLSAPMRGADVALTALLEQHASALLEQGAPEQSPFEARLQVAILACIAEGDASIATVARRLGTSVRSLQRRLSDDDTCFSEAREKALHERAVELLAREELSIDAIASKLGFSSRTTFERAFRRWSGRSPARARRS